MRSCRRSRLARRKRVPADPWRCTVTVRNDGSVAFEGVVRIDIPIRADGEPRFFLEHDRTCVYAVDGTPVDETVLHPVGFIAATAEGSLAAMHSQEPDALDNAIRWVRLLWDTPIRTGTRRYYDNFLYAFAFLALAGEYRTW